MQLVPSQDTEPPPPGARHVAQEGPQQPIMSLATQWPAPSLWKFESQVTPHMVPPQAAFP
jgi:hypothetical protein